MPRAGRLPMGCKLLLSGNKPTFANVAECTRRIRIRRTRPAAAVNGVSKRLSGFIGFKGCLYRRCLPLPIPNRAVKPARADGIAVTGGRVGRCLFLYESPFWRQIRAFLVFRNVIPETKPEANPNPDVPDFIIQSIRHRHRYANACARLFYIYTIAGATNRRVRSEKLVRACRSYQVMGTLLDTGQKPYNHYGSYLKEKYDGQRVFKVIVDGNFTCPNRDGSKGYGGCSYCNVDSFTPESARKLPTIIEQVEAGIERARNGI
ncbi:hypothetical protein FQR65_LT17034 [Abscondita terminalis]|nr:hypothetical protein FQR65_LT17034 [Abscondita terminalis]